MQKIILFLLMFATILTGCKQSKLENSSQQSSEVLLTGQSSDNNKATFPYETSDIGSEKVLLFEKEGLKGLVGINKDKAVTEAIYLSIDYFSEGLALSESENEFHYLNEDGVKEIVIEKTYRDNMYAQGFVDGMAKVGIKDMFSLSIEEKLELGISNKPTIFFSGRIFGVINRTGTFILPISCVEFDYNEDWTTQDTLLVFCVVGDPKWGVINRNGEYVIEPIYDAIYTSSNEVETHAVCKDGKWGYIKYNGDIIITPQYAFAEPFSNGRAVVYDTYISLAIPIDNLEAYIDGGGDYNNPFKLTISKVIDAQNNVLEEGNIATVGKIVDGEYLEKNYVTINDGNMNLEKITFTFENMAIITRYDSGWPVFANVEQNENGEWYLTYEYPAIELYEILEDN